MALGLLGEGMWWEMGYLVSLIHSQSDQEQASGHRLPFLEDAPLFLSVPRRPPWTQDEKPPSTGPAWHLIDAFRQNK